MQAYFWPKVVVWETTLACNMRCLHCGSSAGKARENELNTEEALDVARQLVDMGSEKVILSGGESFLRPDWHLIAELLMQGGVTVGIITNGMPVDNQIIARLNNLKMDARKITIGISLDGLPETHDTIRGVNGSFQKALFVVDRLMKEDIPVIILTTVNKMNIGELEGLRDIILPRKPFAWQFQIVSSYGRMKERQEWLLDENEYLFLVEFLARLKRQTSTTRIDPADCIGYYTELEEDLRGENEQWHGCHAGIRALGIQSNGNVKGCLSLLDDDFFVEGNVRQETILDIWDKPGAFSYNREFTPDKLEGTCKGCPEGWRCRAGCTSTAHSITGSCWNAPYCVYQTKVLNTDREIRLAAAS